MLVAERANLPDLAAQLADVVQAADGRERDTTRFPIPRLRPAGGFTADPALIYGLARVESNFDSASVSGAGARGIMQIMPRTARFVSSPEGGGRIQLDDPAVNLDIGQRYIGHLAGLETVSGDLIRLLASYNAGPGNLGRWGPAIADRGDPLLFIEAVPTDETRTFIPRVLTYSWIYAARLRLPGPGLDDLAAGMWPRYRPPPDPRFSLPPRGRSKPFRPLRGKTDIRNYAYCGKYTLTRTAGMRHGALAGLMSGGWLGLLLTLLFRRQIAPLLTALEGLFARWQAGTLPPAPVRTTARPVA
eukprot:gene4722-6440_t